MARRRGPKARGDDFEMKTRLLDKSDGENDDADYKHTAHAGLSTVADNQENPSTTHRKQYGTSTEAAGHSTGSNKNMRFIVLGSDNLMNEVPALILGQRCMRRSPGICELREGHVQDRHVSVVITPVNWLERLKSFWFFKNAVKELKNEMEFSESLVFPGPHAFLLVIDGQSNKEYLLLDAIREVFGQEALDYSMVLFINACHHNRPKDNRCVKTCGNRFHILNSTRQSVAGLFVEVEEMIQSKKSKFFTNHFEFFKKISVHLQNELKTEYEKKESELLRKLTEMNETVQNQQKKIRDLKTELDLKDAMLREEIDKHKALKQKLTEAGAEQALLTRGQPRTAQRQEVSEHKDEREGETDTREEDSQPSGSQYFEDLKPVRRGSKEIDPPNMSKSEDGPWLVL